MSRVTRVGGGKSEKISSGPRKGRIERDARLKYTEKACKKHDDAARPNPKKRWRRVRRKGGVGEFRSGNASRHASSPSPKAINWQKKSSQKSVAIGLLH